MLSIVRIAVPNLPRRAKVNLFQTYIKSKFFYLLSMISIVGYLEITWKNITKVKFIKIIDFYTMPREAVSLLGLSYYLIIISKTQQKIQRHL